ncbi:MAG: hypothetical protein ACJ72H_11680 [Candidatus Sulfotelmatobacter sp.]
MKRIAISLSCLLVAFVSLVPSAAYAQRGARTAPRSLDRLSQEADLIVRGSVVSARVEPHPQFKNLSTVVVSFAVDETLKGAAKKTIEFRQFIWDIRDKLDSARYAKGSEMLLMLGPVSAYGLRSPVGLEQGRFRILRDSAGKVTALNGTGNLGLLNIPQSKVQSKAAVSSRTAALVRQKPQGALPLADLEEAIRTFAGVSQ